MGKADDSYCMEQAFTSHCGYYRQGACTFRRTLSYHSGVSVCEIVYEADTCGSTDCPKLRYYAAREQLKNKSL